jgi:DNA topoisomerase-1
VEEVARELGNTRAVCRKCYIHPAILESYLEGTLHQSMQGSRVETAVVALLRARLRREADEARRTGAGGRSLAPVLARSLAAAARRLHRNGRSQLSASRGVA